MEWFKKWFESDLYIQVYRHRNNFDAEKIVNLIFNNINISPGDNVLDAACGAGRHSIIVAKKGFNVTGFDLSKNLLKIAKSNSEKQNLSINFFRSDIRKVELNTTFNLVMNLFTSFGYFETDEENFAFPRLAFSKLNTNGYFVLDFLNKNYVEKNLIPQSISDLDNIKIIENRKIVGDRVVKNIEIFSQEESQSFTESVKLYSYRKIRNEFENLGYNLKNVFGNYDGAEFNEFESDRVVFIFQK